MTPRQLEDLPATPHELDRQVAARWSPLLSRFALAVRRKLVYIKGVGENLEADVVRDLAARARRALLAAAGVCIAYDVLYSLLELHRPAPPNVALWRHGLVSVSLAFAVISERARRPRLTYALAGCFSLVMMIVVIAQIALSGGQTSAELPLFFVALGAQPQLFPMRGVWRVLFYGAWFLSFACFVVWIAPGPGTTDLLRVAAVATLAGFAASWVQYHAYKDAVTARRDLREESARAALDAERRRLARDLHDHIGARLTGVALRAERELSRLGPEAVESLTLLQDGMRATITELRDTVWALSERERPANDLLSRMRRYAEDVCNDAGVDVSFDLAPLEEAMPATVSAALLGITREALNNSVRHGKAKRALVQVSKTGNQIELVIEDDGAWRDEEPGGGHGLENMRARARSAGGDLTLLHKDGKTRLQARLSLAVDASPSPPPG